METIFDQKIKRIKEICAVQMSTDPKEIAQKVMDDALIAMHGPEHHILDGAALLTALRNAGMKFDYMQAMEEMEARGRKMPGATCGQWGMCGSSAAMGAALSILHRSSPLSSDEYYKDNLKMTSKALSRLAEIGGPRCCKRNAFLSMQTAIEFIREKYRIELENQPVQCHYFASNAQCIHERCPFFQVKEVK